MPAIYAHKRFGERVFAFLPAPLKEKFEPNKACFLLGLVGPDLLFYHKPFKANETRKRATALHYNSAKDFFISAAKKIQNADGSSSSALSAYVVGFICHFTLDNACHPRIYDLEDQGISHGRIESEFDKYILRREDKQVFGVNHSRHLKATETALQASADVLDVEFKEVRRAIKTLKFINGVFSCRYQTAHRVVHWLLKKLGAAEKYGGMLLHHTEDAACSTINAELYSDLENAIPVAVATVTEYFNELETTARTGEIDDIFDKDYRGGRIHE